MSLKDLRQKNQLTDSIIYAKRDTTPLSPEEADQLKKDTYEEWLKPMAIRTLERYVDATEKGKK